MPVVGHPYTEFSQRHVMKNLCILIFKYFNYVVNKYADTLISLSGLQNQTIKKNWNVLYVSQKYQNNLNNKGIQFLYNKFFYLCASM
jgi:hypothetical protein